MMMVHTAVVIGALTPPSVVEEEPYNISARGVFRVPAQHRETIVRMLDDHQIKDYEAAFKLVDTDSSGSIDAHELRVLFQRLGQNSSKKEVEAMIDEVDVDRNGPVDFEKFLVLMNSSTVSMSVEKKPRHPSGGKNPGEGGFRKNPKTPPDV